MRYFTSDHHFGHHNIIRYCERPYASIDEMDADLIDRWNRVIPRDGEVFVLGDFALTSLGRIGEILRSLNGYAKHLIMGNHDRHKAHMYLKAGFTTARKGQILTSRFKIHDEHKTLYLQHHPWREDSGKPRGHDDWILCGHVHQHWTIRERIKCLNVGVDVHNFAPVDELRIMEMIRDAEDAACPFA